MKLLHSLGPRLMSNYNHPSELADCNDDISFDGVYKNVIQHYGALESWRSKYPDCRLIFFIQGYNVGGDNSADKGAPRLEKMCDWNDVMYMVTNLKGELGWHTWNHKDLTTLTTQELVREVAPPIPMDTIAYPYGRSNSAVEALVKSLGYKEAFCAGPWGDDSQFQRRRYYLNW